MKWKSSRTTLRYEVEPPKMNLNWCCCCFWTNFKHCEILLGVLRSCFSFIIIFCYLVFPPVPLWCIHLCLITSFSLFFFFVSPTSLFSAHLCPPCRVFQPELPGVNFHRVIRLPPDPVPAFSPLLVGFVCQASHDRRVAGPESFGQNYVWCLSSDFFTSG